MKHTASKRFWRCYDDLPADIHTLADKGYALRKTSPSHPSLAFKALAGSRFCTVRVGLYHRALGIPREDGIRRFWIGSHCNYDKLVG